MLKLDFTKKIHASPPSEQLFVLPASPKAILVPVLRSFSVDECVVRQSNTKMLLLKDEENKRQQLEEMNKIILDNSTSTTSSNNTGSSSPPTLKLVQHKPLQDKSSLLWNIEKYTIKHRLGHGSTGSVYLGVHKETKEKVAIKIINKRKTTNYTAGRHEGAILLSISHRSIVKLIKAVENEHRLALVLQYADKGDLHSYVTKNHSNGIPELEAHKLFVELIGAVHFVHLQGYCHRDIKPANILLHNQDNNVLLCDFSMATTWSPISKTTYSCGSVPYVAPEVLSEKPYAGPEIDVFSCGAVLYFMLSGQPPFLAQNDFDSMCNIKQGKKKCLSQNLSASVRHLVDKMLDPNPLKRATILDILTHPWFTSVMHAISQHRAFYSDTILQNDKKDIPLNNSIFASTSNKHHDDSLFHIPKRKSLTIIREFKKEKKSKSFINAPTTIITTTIESGSEGSISEKKLKKCASSKKHHSKITLEEVSSSSSSSSLSSASGSHLISVNKNKTKKKKKKKKTPHHGSFIRRPSELSYIKE